LKEFLCYIYFRRKKESKKLENKYEKYSPKFVINEAGKKSMVLLRMDVFENLIEDLHDLAIVAERREAKRSSYEEFRTELKKEGKL
jgi:hypothetical protein